MQAMFVLSRVLLIASLAPLYLADVSHAEQTPAPSYNQDVRSILSNNCFFCHGPDEENREAEARLDVPGGIDLEEMALRITSTDPDEKMPPPDSHKELSPEQIVILKRWIAAGAPYEAHWAFVPPQLTTFLIG